MLTWYEARKLHENLATLAHAHCLIYHASLQLVIIALSLNMLIYDLATSTHLSPACYQWNDKAGSQHAMKDSEEWSKEWPSILVVHYTYIIMHYSMIVFFTKYCAPAVNVQCTFVIFFPKMLIILLMFYAYT